MKFWLLGIILFFVISNMPFAMAAEAPGPTPGDKYAKGEIVKILIVPGHDDQKSGAVFRGVREADLNFTLAHKIKDMLDKDSSIEVTVSRDEKGYIPELLEYFDENKKDIEDFIADHKKDTERFIEKEEPVISKGVPHNDAPLDVAFKLYGINKWVDEEDFDFVIHIHFNDDASHWGNNMGEYGGFTIYAPEKNLPNSVVSRPLAEKIGERLRESIPITDLPLEREKADEFGVVPDFTLIALGSNKTLETPSILVEYSYIYEPHVRPEFLNLTLQVMARATANGVYNYLVEDLVWKNLSYDWTQVLGITTKKNQDTLALQYALHELGLYPPINRTREECPFTGILGPCTERSLKAFQKGVGLEDDGVVGPKTREMLNALF